MNFLDRMLFQLAHPGELGTLLAGPAGRRILDAAYRTESQLIAAVEGVRVRDLELASPVPLETTLQGTFRPATGGAPWELAGTLALPAETLFLDAQLDLVITIQTTLVDTAIAAVTSESLADLGSLPAIDARILAEDGGLPPPEELDGRRLTAMKQMFRERFAVPADLDVDHLLTTHSITTAAEFADFLARQRIPLRLAVGIVIAPRAAVERLDCPVRLAVLVVEAPFLNLREVLRQIQLTRVAQERSGRPSVPSGGLTPRVAFPFLLVVPAAAFTDPDLPVAEGTPPNAPAAVLEAARLEAVNQRLRPMGIAVTPA